MAIKSAICSNCGGHINVDDVDLNGFAKCEFCEMSHRVIDVIKIEGLPTANNYLINANAAMEDGNVDKAMELFKKVLEIKANCHEAYWGLYSCQSAIDSYYGYKDKYGNSGAITKANIMAESLKKYAYRAIEYAPEDIAEKYRHAIAADEKFIYDVQNGKYDKSSSDMLGKSHSGCYIATAVYGSYNCEEVMQLRRFRDECLSKNTAGRLFIKFYYTVSPFMSRHIKPNSFVGKTLRKFLDWFSVRV